MELLLPARGQEEQVAAAVVSCQRLVAGERVQVMAERLSAVAVVDSSVDRARTASFLVVVVVPATLLRVVAVTEPVEPLSSIIKMKTVLGLLIVLISESAFAQSS